MKEKAVLFGKTDSLVGITTASADSIDSNKPAVIILNTGIVHRVGPNRQSVTIARNLGRNGHTVFRFDSSGIGDSKARRDTLPFRESAVEETREAMDYLQTTRGIEKFILMGICSGGFISFRTACRDTRVIGAMLINTRGHLHGDNDELGASLRNRTLARHYVRIAIFSSFRKKNWNKIFTGKISVKNLLKMSLLPLKRLFIRKKSSSKERRTETGADLRKLNFRGVRILHIYSEGDEGIDYMYAIFGKRLESLARNGILDLEIVKETNHTFTLLWSQGKLAHIINEWTDSLSSNL